MWELLRPLLIAILVLTEVALWQWRVLIAARGHRRGAVLLGFVGAVLQITAISQVVTNVDDPLSIGAYAAGVGTGVLLGLVAGESLTPGSIRVTIVTGNPALADHLWARGWPVTVQTAQGAAGPVAMLSLTISRADEDRLYDDVVPLAPEADWYAAEVRPRSSVPVLAQQ